MPNKRMSKTDKRAASDADEAYFVQQEALPKPTAEMLAIAAEIDLKAAAKALRYAAWADRKAAKKARRSANSSSKQRK
jgi:hypothetical protein